MFSPTLSRIRSKAPTCSAKGQTTYTATFTTSAFKTQTKTVSNIPATGHSWGAVTYTWSSDYSKVTAKRVCTANSSHVQKETVSTTAAVTKAATCTAKGQTTYTAVFENSAFKTQTKVVTNIDALGHSYGEYKRTRMASGTTSGILTETCSRCGRKVMMVVPPTIAKAASPDGTKATFTWKAVRGAERYRITLSTCAKAEATIVGTTTDLTFTKTGLKAGTCYRFRVIAQRMIGGAWTTISSSYYGHFVTGDTNATNSITNVKSVTLAKTELNVKVGKSVTSSTYKPVLVAVKAAQRLLGTDHAEPFRYTSSDSSVATVDTDGKITGVKAGSCTIYVVAVNGVSKAIKVTVTAN